MIPDLVVYALAVWRLAHMVAKEDGPGNLLLWLRDDATPEPVRKGLRCVSCVSVWAAGLLLIAPWWVRVMLAGSGAAKLLEDYLYGETHPLDDAERVWGEDR